MSRGKNFRGETLAEARAQLVNVLKAQKSWVTSYAEAYIGDFEDMAHDAIQRALDATHPQAASSTQAAHADLWRKIGPYIPAEHQEFVGVCVSLALTASSTTPASGGVETESAPDCPRIENGELVYIRWRDREGRRCSTWRSAQQIGDDIMALSAAPEEAWARMTFDGNPVACHPDIRERVECALLAAALDDLAEREAAAQEGAQGERT